MRIATLRGALVAGAVLCVPVHSLGASYSPEQLLKKGLSRFQRGELRGAVKLLGKVAAKLPQRWQRARAYLYRGLARAYLKARGEARRDFVRALINDPRIRPDRDRVPPDVAALFAKARASLSGVLEIVGGRPGTQVQIGDTGRWSLPFREKVPAGDYPILFFDAAGRQIFRRRLVIPPGGKAKISLGGTRGKKRPHAAAAGDAGTPRSRRR